jgi:hypothetical protein
MQQVFKKYPIQTALILYAIILAVVVYTKPALFFHPNGNVKEFGVGDGHRTIFPLWLFAITAAIITYFVVMLLAYGTSGKMRIMSGGGGGGMGGVSSIIVDMMPASQMK